MSAPLIERIAAEHAATADSLPSAVVPRARRKRALDSLIARGLPTSREENWRYASLRALERVRFAPPASGAGGGREQLPAAVEGFARFVFIDGRFAAELSDPTAPPGGVIVDLGSRAAGTATIPAEPDPERGDEGAFALLNDAFAVDGAHVRVGSQRTDHSGTTAEAVARVEIIHLASAPAERGASYPRIRVDVAERARLELIERHVGPAESASFIDSAVELRVQAGAVVEHFRLQQLGARALWVDTLSASVARGASYRLHSFGFGAQSARSTQTVRLLGDGAETGLYSICTGDHRQVLDSYALVEHAAARTRTEEIFRGIAAGRARVAFNGKIIVRPGAPGADSSQSLRGLLAGPEAEIDVRPQLEIYTDDVRCSHGATTGKLDEAMLFYLLSRGLDRDQAQRLLKWAFLEDVVARVAVPALRRQIETSLADQIRERDGLKELL